MSKITILLLTVLVSLTRSGYCETVRLKCTADTNISSYEGEQNLNYGHSTRLRLKGIQMMALFQFDTAAISGWTVERATLHLRYANADRKLRTLGISTISAPWVEGTGVGEQKEGETTFTKRGDSRWAGPDTDFTDVSFTAGNTRAMYADITVKEDGWFTVSVEPSLVQAMITGVTYGLAVTDEKGQTSANNDIFSREQNGSEPYLEIEGSPKPSVAPKPPKDVSVTPDPVHADFKTGAVKIALLSPQGTFAYAVQVLQNGTPNAAPQPLERFAIPFAEPGKRQSIIVRNLAPESKVTIKIWSLTQNGTVGASSQATGIASLAKFQPSALAAPLHKPSRPVQSGNANSRIRLTYYPDVAKIDPITGRQYNDSGGNNAAQTDSNLIGSGVGAEISGARNEILGFQILISAVNTSVKGIRVVAPEELRSSKASFKPEISLFRDWYVKSGEWYPEAAIPIKDTVDIPAADNGIPGQRNQLIFVDLRIPTNTAPGDYTGMFRIGVPGEAEHTLPVTVHVSPLTLPDQLSFDISLNTYGTLGGLFGIDDRTAEYRTVEREFHRIAHTHRTTLAPLGYSHSGNISTNYAPPVAGDGAGLHVTDWSAWDAQFGPYLDGTAFADLPRRSVPITHLYLPFHEAWPVDIRRHYEYQGTATKYPELIAEHALTAEPIEKAVDQELRSGFETIARQFADHFKQKGWTHTAFQFYQNDKYYYKDPKTGGRGTSWWLLDEPNHRDDWLALAFFNRLFKQGIGSDSGVNFVIREDVSRPQWQRNYLDGLVDVMCVSGELYTKGPRLREMQETLQVKYWNYGTANQVNRPNTEAESWAVNAWLHGADAIVPWQSVGSDSNFEKAEETALLLPGTRFGIKGPVASLRLKALRRAQQDVEYLVLLGRAKGWDREQAAAALKQIFAVKGTTVKQDDNDAGTYQFSGANASTFDAMRSAISNALTSASTTELRSKE